MTGRHLLPRFRGSYTANSATASTFMRFRFPVLVATALALVASAAHAHHSFSAMYDATKPVRLVGKLSKVEWTNPHSYFYLDVKSKDGNVATWACEGAGPGALS